MRFDVWFEVWRCWRIRRMVPASHTGRKAGGWESQATALLAGYPQSALAVQMLHTRT